MVGRGKIGKLQFPVGEHVVGGDVPDFQTEKRIGFDEKSFLRIMPATQQEGRSKKPGAQGSRVRRRDQGVARSIAFVIQLPSVGSSPSHKMLKVRRVQLAKEPQRG